MSTVFTINFRREAYQREVARTRRRAVRLGLWVLYFGGLGVVLGLYGLNIASLAQRVNVVERQIERLRRHPRDAGVWRPGRPEAAEVRRHLLDASRWNARMTRLAALLPSGAVIEQLEFNPDNASGAVDPKLVITASLNGAGGDDRMRQVMSIVNQLSRDSTFADGYHNVRLVSTRADDKHGGAEFVLECR